MEKREVCRKYLCLGHPDQRTVVYYVVQERTTAAPPTYGVGITIMETGEERMLCNLTLNADVAEHLADLLATGSATPQGMETLLSNRQCVC